MTTATGPAVLVAGIGNIFLGDDGFGVEVANRLAGVALPPGARSRTSASAASTSPTSCSTGYDALVLVDAVPMGEPPGTVAIIEPDWPLDPTDAAAPDEAPRPTMDAHSMNPAIVLAMLASMGGEVQRVLVVGCQPSVIDEGIGLSPPVAAGGRPGVAAVLEVLAELSRAERGEEPSVMRRLIWSLLLIALADVGREVPTGPGPVPEDEGDVGMAVIGWLAVVLVGIVIIGGIVVAVTAAPRLQPLPAVAEDVDNHVARYRIVPGHSQGLDRGPLHPPPHPHRDRRPRRMARVGARHRWRRGPRARRRAPTWSCASIASRRATRSRTASCAGGSTPVATRLSPVTSPSWQRHERGRAATGSRATSPSRA